MIRMPFDHMPVLTSVKGSGPESGHIPSFLASGEIRRHRPPAPTCKGLQALSNLTPCDRGRDGPREGRRPGGSHSSFGETGVRGGDSTSGWTLTPCGLEVLVALVAVDSTATLGLSCSFLPPSFGPEHMLLYSAPTLLWSWIEGQDPQALI